MPQNQTMTLDEKLAIGCKAEELWEAGDEEGYICLMKTAPLPPYLAKVYKEKLAQSSLWKAAGICRKRRLNLVLAGLIDSIYGAAAIDSGRKGFATRGKEQEGRINYETGIAVAMASFRKAQATADPEAIILAEYTFLSQELEFCEKTDKDSISSLSKAIRTFDDAFLALKTVEGSKIAVKFLLPPWESKRSRKEDGSISFELELGTMVKIPENGSNMEIWIDQSQIRFVKQSPENVDYSLVYL
jgi:hypothetical protein